MDWGGAAANCVQGPQVSGPGPGLLGAAWLAAGAAAALAAIPLGWQFVLAPYQKARILTFLEPEADIRGAGWHILESKIALGSGGVFGKGWLQGTQSHLDF